MIRLNKFLAQAGIASRRKCDDFIKAGYVKVNGKVVDQVGVVIDETKDKVTFKGKPVKPKKRFIYIVLNKPKGVVTTAKDQFNRKTVLDLIAIPERIFPIGRLDYNTTGVLLLTDDGDLAHRLLHPNYKVLKTYRVLLNKVIRPIDMHRLQTGIELDGVKTQPCKIRELRIIDNGSLLEIELTEGRNRQVRRMFAALNYKVRELERISFGGITASGLAPGEWRYLNRKEVNLLKGSVGYGS